MTRLADLEEPALAYQARAETIAQSVADEWRTTRPGEDPRALADAVHQALVEEANLELRQVLAHLGGHLDMAHTRLRDGRTALTAERLESLREAVGRARDLMDVFLDRASAARLVIRIDPEPFDLAEALRLRLQAQGLSEEVVHQMAASPVLCDREKVCDVLMHLVTRFYFSMRGHERVSLSIASREGRIEGFVGLTPSRMRAEDLLEQIRAPFLVEGVGIDLAYVRAVLERHQGGLFVATAGEASVGFGFHLPLLKENPS